MIYAVLKSICMQVACSWRPSSCSSCQLHSSFWQGPVSEHTGVQEWEVRHGWKHNSSLHMCIGIGLGYGASVYKRLMLSFETKMWSYNHITIGGNVVIAKCCQGSGLCVEHPPMKRGLPQMSHKQSAPRPSWSPWKSPTWALQWIAHIMRCHG